MKLSSVWISSKKRISSFLFLKILCLRFIHTLYNFQFHMFAFYVLFTGRRRLGICGFSIGPFILMAFFYCIIGWNIRNSIWGSRIVSINIQVKQKRLPLAGHIHIIFSPCFIKKKFFLSLTLNLRNKSAFWYSAISAQKNIKKCQRKDSSSMWIWNYFHFCWHYLLSHIFNSCSYFLWLFSLLSQT